MMIQRTSDPGMWRWLAVNDDAKRKSRPVKLASPPPSAEGDETRADFVVPGPAEHNPALPADADPSIADVIVAGPTDQDPEEADAAAEEFQAVEDREPLVAAEMPAYWRLLRWSRAQSFDALLDRAQSDVLFTQLWQSSPSYRGKLIELRLHVRRALRIPAPKNSAGVKELYEVWGWTDESASSLYVALFSDLPPDFPIGENIREEATFVGYFLKNMSYIDKLDKKRAAPLLIGRLHRRENPALALLDRQTSYFWPTFLGASVVLGAVVATWIKNYRRPPSTTSPEQLLLEKHAIENWLTQVETPEGAEQPQHAVFVDTGVPHEWLDPQQDRAPQHNRADEPGPHDGGEA